MIQATAPDGLRGADILLPLPSVGATENLLLAAVLADGTTTIRNAAREPEIADLAACLIAMGATIAGLGSHQLTIEGGRALAGAVHTVLPDRIEFGTLACAAAATDGELVLPHGRLALLGAAAPLYEAAGVAMRETADGVVVQRARARPARHRHHDRPLSRLRHRPAGADHGAAGTAPGASTVTETDLRAALPPCRRVAARWAPTSPSVGRTALVRGVARLQGAAATCTDVRAAAALVIAGLCAGGETRLDGLDHLDRGYDGITEKLAAVGADIVRSDTGD